MDTHTSSRRARVKLAQEQEVAGDWRRPLRDRSHCAVTQRDFGTKEQENEGREVMLGTLFKLLVKGKLLHSGKAPVNETLRRDKRRTEVQ